MTYRQRTNKLKVVRRALELGWVPFEANTTARKHFYFDGPVELSVDWFSQEPSITLGDTTTNESHALQLLERMKV
jgi:hypothetical protein